MSTRLVIYAPNGAPVAPDGHPIGLDLSAVPNADAQASLIVVVERECNLGSWHAIGSTPLPLYSPDDGPA